MSTIVDARYIDNSEWELMSYSYKIEQTSIRKLRMKDLAEDADELTNKNTFDRWGDIPTLGNGYRPD